MLKAEQEAKVWSSFNKWLVSCSETENVFYLDTLLTVIVRGVDGMFNVSMAGRMDVKHKDYFRNKRNSFVSTYLMQTQQDPQVMLREESIEFLKDYIHLLNNDAFPKITPGEFLKEKKFRQAKATLTKTQSTKP